MAFMDNMKGRLSQASQSTVQKAKDLSELNKLNRAISEAEVQIGELYSQLGYDIYCAYKEKPLPEAEEAIEKISDLHKSIEVCKLQIMALNSANTCPKCGAKIKQGMAFCSGCGYKLPVEENAIASEKKAYCSNCGAEIAPGCSFCTSCGKKVE